MVGVGTDANMCLGGGISLTSSTVLRFPAALASKKEALQIPYRKQTANRKSEQIQTTKTHAKMFHSICTKFDSRILLLE